ncbi:hypothetical protein CP970_33435 [Streptomyces kanamyceticus]|uniref:Uncharacterized protein n=1 Tax=Streptomyces kanamyceticus TaxID=1967 RepID=A0A5J6GGR5_STRKN|nr:hypothetical protein CP970_33435 [Streptomyces kanamyceticus]
MCSHCEDLARTVAMLGDLALYDHTPGADQEFINVMGPSLAASLPEPPPGYDPTRGPNYPGQG